LVAIVRQRPADCGGLAEVELAAQCGERYFAVVVHDGLRK
jgi:hypothetical protein